MNRSTLKTSPPPLSLNKERRDVVESIINFIVNEEMQLKDDLFYA
jgi:hypothetical protein